MNSNKSFDSICMYFGVSTVCILYPVYAVSYIEQTKQSAYTMYGIANAREKSTQMPLFSGRILFIKTNS